MLDLGNQPTPKKHHNISLETHLCYWIDPEIDWSVHLRRLRNQGIIGDELRKRVGFAIAVCQKQNVDTHQKVNALVHGNKWASFNEKPWNKYLDQLENKITDIRKTHISLSKIPYIDIHNVSKEAKTLHVVQWVRDAWALTDTQSSIIVALYGERLISAFSNDTKETKKGIFNFMLAIDNWCQKNEIDPIKVKEIESKSMQKFY